MTNERFPIGKYEPPEIINAAVRNAWIAEIATLPAAFRKAFEGLNDDQLDTPYREGGWSLRQVAHHVPDSHMNAYIRFKWALTEDFPTIKAYDEAAWATLPDGENTPVEVSLALLDSLHTRWTVLLQNMNDADFQRAYLHPEFLPENFQMSDAAGLDLEMLKTAGPLPPYIFLLERVLGLYAWHGKHHTAHITALRDRLGW